MHWKLFKTKRISARVLSCFARVFYYVFLLYCLGTVCDSLLVIFTSILLPIVQVGCIPTSSLLNENHDFLRLAINTVRNDIIGRNETFQCLALTMVWLSITCIHSRVVHSLC